MDYRETLDYLYRQLPIFQRVGKAAYKADLSNTIALCDILDHPYRRFKSVHIAGTNGKGSTSHLLASILQEQGLKVGLYTSPHLKDFRERIKINGSMISKDFIVDFVAKYKERFEPIQPSFFEMTVGMAFEYFAEEHVDIAVIETGLGGRLDSTNVITPEVSVITNISLDHTNLLGDTIDAIAREKAGIIKPARPVVIGSTTPESKAVFEEFATSNQTQTLYAEDYPVPALESELKGPYQDENIRTAFYTIATMRTVGWSIQEEAVQRGIAKVNTNTGFTGRWQTLSTSPLTICDIGHNEAGIKGVLQQLDETPHEHLHVVLGMVNDKDVEKILKMLPKDAAYYFCQAQIPRALDKVELQQQAAQEGLRGNTYETVSAAIGKAQTSAKADDLVFIGGSAFVVAEAL